MVGDLQALISALDGFQLCPSQVVALRDLQKQIAQDEVIISVIGQFKRGKSSLINGLLGEDLLPIGIVPLTSVATEIRYGGEASARVYFADSVCDIELSELPFYCSEEHNGSNHKQVQVVRVTTPHHPFGEGVVLVDTPGVGSINQRNTDETVEHLIHSDAILFVLSVDSPVSQTELDFLREAKAYASKFYFAVNKIDTVSAADLEAFCTYCRGVVEEELGCEVTFYPVSATTKAGLPELKHDLNESLHAAHGQLLHESAERKLDILLRQIRGIIELEEKSAATPASELAQKLLAIEKQKRELLTFADQLEVLAQHHTDNLVRDIEYEMNPHVEELRQELPYECAVLAENLNAHSLADFKVQYQEKLNDYLKERLGNLNEEGLSQLSSGYAHVVSFLGKQTDKAEECLSEFLFNEFGIDYPAAENHFEVSDRSDFVMHVGIRGVPKLDDELMDHLLPKKKAEKRFLAEALRQAQDDVDCNYNNMLYNYRYKMQESLRPLCREMAERILNVSGELDEVKDILQGHLENAQFQQADVNTSLQKIKDIMKECGM